MKVFLFILAATAFVSAEDSDNTIETAINFIKDCHGDYILCVKVNNFINKVKVKCVLWNQVSQWLMSRISHFTCSKCIYDLNCNGRLKQLTFTVSTQNFRSQFGNSSK